jgi:hypothetical protein
MRTTNCDFVVVGARPPDVFWTIDCRKRRSLTTRQRLLQRGCSGPGIAGNLDDWEEESYGEDQLPGGGFALEYGLVCWPVVRDALVMHDCLRIGVPDLSRRFFAFALRESVLPGR